MFFKKKAPKLKAKMIDSSNFQEEVMDNDKIVFLDFWAPWCGPCKVIGPIIDELAEDNKDKPIMIGKVNVDENPQISAQFRVQSIPTLVFMHKGKVIQQVSGMVPKPNLQEFINELLQKVA